LKKRTKKFLSVVEAAPAKVNLYLHVTARRADGYHLLDSLAVFPAMGDVLAGEADAELSLAVAGPFAAGLQGEADNLVLRAARWLAASHGIKPRARLLLTKNLPLASGIGGGSADAAAALRLLSKLWRVPLPDATAAAALGADVPVCLAAQPARMSGIGETLAPAPELPDGFIVLVNPGVGVSTPAVFRVRTGGFSEPASLPTAWPNFAAMAADLASLRNDLEPAAIQLQPVIGTILTALRAQPGCALARMSGSGATCFGLFADAADAIEAAQTLRGTDWWCWAGVLTGLAETQGGT
jgi:4-diphosphocytidyl-2-C-methyl-D-erythritol kinase